MFVERLGILAFVVSLALFAAVVDTPRHVAVLFLSVSFQTNAIAVAYFVCVELRCWYVAGILQTMSLCYLSVVAGVWFVALGGKEANWHEWLFNTWVHYGMFVGHGVVLREGGGKKLSQGEVDVCHRLPDLLSYCSPVD